MTANAASIPMTVSQSVATPARVGSRLALLDASRLLAALGIVWVHATAIETGGSLAPALYPIGTFGVPFYIFVAVLFMARSFTRDPELTIGNYFATRLYRVYLPFLLWTGVYVLLTEAKQILNTGSMRGQPWSVLYTGGHQHLWFLPFLMTVTLVGAAMVRGLEHRTTFRWIVIIVLALAGVMLAFVPEPAWIATRGPSGDREFWRFVYRAIPSSCWAIALALGTAMKGQLPRAPVGVAVAGMIIFVGSLLLQDHTGSITILRASAGLGVTLVALWPVVLPAIERVGRLGRFSYGIYLSHVLFVRIAVLWLQRFDIEPSLLIGVVTFVVAFMASLGLSVLFSKSRYTRWVLGE